MFANCCDNLCLCGCEKLQGLVDYLGPLKPYIEYYMTHCPFACFTGYALLGLATLFFFVLWRRAIVAWKHEKANVEYLSIPSASPTCCAMPPMTCTTDTEKVLAVVERIQSHALETVNSIQSDCVRQLAQAHSDALEKVERIVESLSGMEEDDE